MASKKLILVIGATGAMGRVVVEHLLRDTEGNYAVRALTRSPNSEAAKEVAALGAEIVEGNTSDLPSIERALIGVYGVFGNTDFWSAGYSKEIEQGKQLAELSERAGVKHFVWSSLDNTYKLGGEQRKYRCLHYESKAVVAEYLQTEKPSFPWTVLNTAPYYDNFKSIFLPRKDADGTLAFTNPLGSAGAWWISIEDIAWFAKYIFDHPQETLHKTFDIAGGQESVDEVVATFVKVAGKKARVQTLTLEQYESFMPDKGLVPGGDFGMTVPEDISAMFRSFIDGIIPRDVEALKKIHPGLMNWEAWLRSTGWDGEPGLVQNMFRQKK